jgi:hypothetical protein
MVTVALDGCIIVHMLIDDKQDLGFLISGFLSRVSYLGSAEALTREPPYSDA